MHSTYLTIFYLFPQYIFSFVWTTKLYFFIIFDSAYSREGTDEWATYGEINKFYITLTTPLFKRNDHHVLLLHNFGTESFHNNR